MFRERHRAGLARFRKTGSGSIIDSGRAVELPALRRCGEQITIELTLSPITASWVPGHFVLAIIRDTTERKQAELGSAAPDTMSSRPVPPQRRRQRCMRPRLSSAPWLSSSRLSFRSTLTTKRAPRFTSVRRSRKSSAMLRTSTPRIRPSGYGPCTLTTSRECWSKLRAPTTRANPSAWSTAGSPGMDE